MVPDIASIQSSLSMVNQPKVSVLLLTYNHQEYICTAIDSILMQQVDFRYEIIIGEDFSIDKTREFVIDYQQRYPDLIRLVLPEQNLGLGGKKLFLQALPLCQGEYIALLDGDDFWTSPHKLQTQVDFLDAHLECTICFHNALELLADGTQKPWLDSRQIKPISTLRDILKTDFIPNCSTMYRRGLFTDFPDWFFAIVSADWALHIFNACYGDIGYINEVMAVYRIHTHGAWNSLDDICKYLETLKFYSYINIYLDYKYNKIIQLEMAWISFLLATCYKNQNDWLSTYRYLLVCCQCLFTFPFVQIDSLMEFGQRIWRVKLKNRFWRSRR